MSVNLFCMRSKSSVFAVGGLGGSGTRVVARILLEAGIYLGDDLNRENDNLVFCRLFKDPEWLEQASGPEIDRRLRIFENYMTGRPWSISMAREYYSRSRGRLVKDNRPLYHRWISFAKLFPGNERKGLWGWKEPNTHIYLKHIAGFFDDFKYVHVIRNGLDMAFSSNHQQLVNWGHRFGIDASNMKDREEMAAKQLEYWIRMNRSVQDICLELLPDNHMILHFRDLCENPAAEIVKLLEFLDIAHDERLVKRLALIPVTPRSHSRFMKEDLSIFTGMQLRAVEALMGRSK